MSTISHEPARIVREKPRWMEFAIPEMWASFAITAMWVARFHHRDLGARREVQQR